MVTCSKGHYYDEKKYMVCPYCGIDDDEDGKTVAMHSGSPAYDATMVPMGGLSASPIDFVITPGASDNVTMAANPEVPRYVAGWLVCIQGEDKGRDFRIYKGNNFVGRDYSMDIRVENDETVSRKKHCSIIYEPKQSRFYVKPMENLVYAGERMLDATEELYSGQELTIGNSTFVFIAFCGEDRRWEE